MLTEFIYGVAQKKPAFTMAIAIVAIFAYPYHIVSLRLQITKEMDPIFDILTSTVTSIDGQGWKRQAKELCDCDEPRHDFE